MTATSGALTELKNDLKELEGILVTVTRANVRQIVCDCISSLKVKINLLEEKERAEQELTRNSEDKLSSKQLYNTKITTYGWDESSKFVKLYVTLQNMSQIKPEQLSCDFTEHSFKLTIHNHNDRNHVLQIMNLAHNIKPTESCCKIKADNVLVMLKKEVESKTWSNLTEAQRKEKEAKDSKFSEGNKDMETSDPSAGIMNMMKKMYDEGDDDMKRMIKKTWYESQQKQASGGMPPLS